MTNQKQLHYWWNNSFGHCLFLQNQRHRQSKVLSFQCLLRWFSMFVCLFGVFRPIREFFTHMETSPLPVKGCKFWPMLGTEQWGFFSMTHYLWRWASVYNGYPRGPVTFAPNPERLEVELSLHVPVLTTLICHGWDSNTLSYACGRIWRWHHYRWRGSNVDLPPRWLLGRGFVSRAGGRVSSPGRSNR